MTSCCPCDVRIFPLEPDVPAGLTVLPRQVVGFPEYRRAMLGAVRAQAPLADWRAREGVDLGLMVVEWWAYVLDVVAFYDGQIAQNAYLRCATSPAAIRRLTALVGYRPRPAVAAEALLAALADSGPDVAVPIWTPFQSEAFGSEPPQIFESDAAQTITWRKNRWTLAPVRRATAPGGALLLELASVRVARDTWIVATWGSSVIAGRVTGVAPVTALDGATYAQVTTVPAMSVPGGTALASVTVQMATVAAGFNRMVTPVSGTDILLDGVYPQITAGQRVILTNADGAVLPVVVSSTTVAPVVPTTPLVGVVPTLPVTKLTLTATLAGTGWATTQSGFVRFQLVDAGRVTRPAETRLQRADIAPSAALAGVVEPLDPAADGPLLIEDRDHVGLTLESSVHVTPGGIGTMTTAPSTEPFAKALVPPVWVYGNVLHVVRGETVAFEVLGSGDASVAYPSFKLKKKPLTYIASPGAADGRRSTLQVRVNGLLWSEVDSFFGVDPALDVFIVRQNEDQDSFVTFRRLPSGVNNVTARYRFGAGAARPPAGTINQMVRPVKGVRVTSPMAPYGGADADRPQDIRKNAPTIALTLGRAVSLADFEALARGFGAVNVSAGWAWDGSQQRAVMTLWYVSDIGDISAPLRRFLAAQADPNVPMRVMAATPFPARLVMDIVVGARFEPVPVRRALIATMTDPDTGPLAHANVPIGGSLFRSELEACAMAVPGVEALNRLTLNGAAMPVAWSVNEGRFLDFLPFTNE